MKHTCACGNVFDPDPGNSDPAANGFAICTTCTRPYILASGVIRPMLPSDATRFTTEQLLQLASMKRQAIDLALQERGIGVLADSCPIWDTLSEDEQVDLVGSWGVSVFFGLALAGSSDFLERAYPTRTEEQHLEDLLISVGLSEARRDSSNLAIAYDMIHAGGSASVGVAALTLEKILEQAKAMLAPAQAPRERTRSGGARMPRRRRTVH